MIISSVYDLLRSYLVNVLPDKDRVFHAKIMSCKIWGASSSSLIKNTKHNIIPFLQGIQSLTMPSEHTIS
jgi:hypothetical protein